MLLRLLNISKSFGSVRALEGVQLEVFAGEIHAVCGENGAGKSTLMNIISGNVKPDTGSIEFDSKVIYLSDSQDAINLGISIVYQHLSLMESVSVAENIFASKLPTTSFGLINYKTLNLDAKRLLASLNIRNIDPSSLVVQLSAGQRQLVEIAKALAKNPKLLILDEPTASVSEQDAQMLFTILRDLKERGVAIIYISHRLTEIFTIADKVTVLKDGKYQGTLPRTGLTRDALIKLMVGRDISKFRSIKKTYAGTPLLEVKNISGHGYTNLSFEVYPGEIVGFAGLIGAGRTEMAKGIFGVNALTTGTVFLRGKQIDINNPSKAIDVGICYLPEDRRKEGLFLNTSVQDNIVCSWLSKLGSMQWYNQQEVTDTAKRYIDKLKINTESPFKAVEKLSGGNQQKVMLGKWLLTDPDILIVDEPTHGVDVGVKQEIYSILSDLAAKGKSIIVISSDLQELLSISDRIMVMKHGEITGQISGESATEEQVMSLAT
jgi:ABC-type sugar transport system ATPase subunit